MTAPQIAKRKHFFGQGTSTVLYCTRNFVIMTLFIHRLHSKGHSYSGKPGTFELAKESNASSHVDVESIGKEGTLQVLIKTS